MTTRVVVFGREPVVGKVKRRLARGLGADAAARIYAAVLDHTLNSVAGCGVPCFLSLAEKPSERWKIPDGFSLEIQVSGELGDRMAATFDQRFREGTRRVVLLGSDCPWVTAAHIHAAIAALKDSEVVIGPATDGGYWLVAQRAPGFDLFSGVPWSSPGTLDRTRNRLAAIGATWTEIEELRDIDTASDLEAVLNDPRTPEGLRNQFVRTLKR
jgi:rSAM/selenodomain-associated transferase 1